MSLGISYSGTEIFQSLAQQMLVQHLPAPFLARSPQFACCSPFSSPAARRCWWQACPVLLCSTSRDRLWAGRSKAEPWLEKGARSQGVGNRRCREKHLLSSSLFMSYLQPLPNPRLCTQQHTSLGNQGSPSFLPFLFPELTLTFYMSASLFILCYGD